MAQGVDTLISPAMEEAKGQVERAAPFTADRALGHPQVGDRHLLAGNAAGDLLGRELRQDDPLGRRHRAARLQSLRLAGADAFGRQPRPHRSRASD